MSTEEKEHTIGNRPIPEITLPKVNNALKILFYFSLLTYLIMMTPIIIFITPLSLDQFYDIIVFSRGIILIPAMILWSYCIYFYYKFDKYSSSGIMLIFFNVFYSPLYFYKVIWKKKRAVINKINKH